MARTAANTRQQRHEAILELIDGHYVRSQAELQDLLQERGHEVNQGTLSRDLRELRVVKSPDGYALPAAAPAGTAVQTAVRQWLRAALVAQHQVVLKTPPGGAQPLAIALDQGPYPGVLGTIAGDDTVLVICAKARDATRVADELEGLR